MPRKNSRERSRPGNPYPAREVSMSVVNSVQQRSTMSARGRKLTALTPRKANSRKITISYHQIAKKALSC